MTDDDKLYQSRPGRTYQPRPKKAPLESETKQLRELSNRINSMVHVIYLGRTISAGNDDLMGRLDYVEDELVEIAAKILDITYDIERES